MVPSVAPSIWAVLGSPYMGATEPALQDPKKDTKRTQNMTLFHPKYYMEKVEIAALLCKKELKNLTNVIFCEKLIFILSTIWLPLYYQIN
jgi:hypothetical protein